MCSKDSTSARTKRNTNRFLAGLPESGYAATLLPRRQSAPSSSATGRLSCPPREWGTPFPWCRRAGQTTKPRRLPWSGKFRQACQFTPPHALYAIAASSPSDKPWETAAAKLLVVAGTLRPEQMVSVAQLSFVLPPDGRAQRRFTEAPRAPFRYNHSIAGRVSVATLAGLGKSRQV